MDHKAVLSRVPYEYAFEFPDFPLAVKPRFGTLAPEMHIHERFCEIVLIVSGATVHHCEKHTYPIHSQEIFVIDPGMCHCYEESDVGYYNILVDLNTLKLPLYNLTETAGYRNLFVLGPRSHLVEEGTPVRNFLSSGQFSECVTLLQQMCDLQTVRKPGWQFAMLSLFTDFLRVVCGIGEGGAVPVESAPPHLIADIAMHITRHCQEPWPIERLCKACKLSRAVFFREFKKYYDTTPSRFLCRQRLRKAQALLRSTDLPMENIATQCGFSGGNYFSMAFARYFGCTPLQYRRDPGRAKSEPKAFQER